MNRKLKQKELGRISVEEFKKAEKLSVVVVLDNVRSSYNAGSVFRTCDAFRVRALFLCGITPRPPHREIRKTALGATESVEWHYFEQIPDAIRQLKDEGYVVVAVEQTEGAIPLEAFETDTQHKYALVFGNEVKGVSQEAIDLCDHAIEIPQEGTKHSFNISVSAGIVLWEFYRKIKAAG